MVWKEFSSRSDKHKDPEGFVFLWGVTRRMGGGSCEFFALCWVLDEMTKSLPALCFYILRWVLNLPSVVAMLYDDSL